MSYAVKIAIVMLASALLPGCVSAAHHGRLEPTSIAEALASGSLLAASDLDRQILVTIDNQPQLDLRRAGSTIRGYFSSGAYRVSPAASQVAEQLGHGCVVLTMERRELVEDVMAAPAAECSGGPPCRSHIFLRNVFSKLP